MALHPILGAAAAGTLPAWARMSGDRLSHVARVAALVDAWGESLGLGDAERRRWCAAAWLHDALRDAPPAELVPDLPPEFRALPGALFHGPAVAARLERAGVRDPELLRAIAYHTLGHPELDRLGRILYLADFLEPGRAFDPVRRASLRARMPGSMNEVLRYVVAARLHHLLRTGRTLRPESVAFWNAIAGME